MLEKIKDFKEALSERIKSPFIGSFIISWSILHWKIFVMLFYYEDKLTIQNRIDKISIYLKTENFLTLAFYPALITLLVIFSYNVLNAIGLFIKLLYDNWASPYIQKTLYNKNIIEKSKYEKLKREYATVKQHYDDDKEKFVDNEKQHRELSNTFAVFRDSSFEGRLLAEITLALRPDFKWQYTHTSPEGISKSELFSSDSNGLKFNNGATIKVENIKISIDGKLLMFDKVLGQKKSRNYLIRDLKGNYSGIEDNNIAVTYKARRQDIIIQKARYFRDSNFIDVTEKVRDLISNDILEFQVTNDLMGGDPYWGEAKNLEIICTINGNDKVFSAIENATVRIE